MSVSISVSSEPTLLAGNVKIEKNNSPLAFRDLFLNLRISRLSFVLIFVKSQHDAAEVKGKKNLAKKLSALERTTQEGEALLKVSSIPSKFQFDLLLLFLFILNVCLVVVVL